MPDNNDSSNAQSSPRRSTILRFPSYSKRHASFSSPREFPLPSPVLSHGDAPNPFLQQESSTTPPHSPTWNPFFLDSMSPLAEDFPFARCHRPHHSQHSSSTSTSTVHSREHRPPAEQSSIPSESDHAPVYPSSNRPLSVPDSQSPSYSSALSSYLRQQPSQSPTPPIRSTTWIDRNSSASLPLPSQVPFYSLPQVQTTSRISEGSSSTDSVSQHSGFRCPSLDGSNSSSSSLRSESPVSSMTQEAELSCPSSQKAPSPNAPHSEGMLPDVETTASQADLLPQRPSSPLPFRAPRPPSPDASFFSHIPEFTAMRRYMTPSQQARTLPPLEPPTILENTTQNGASAAYAPFLSHAPAPPDCRIEIETTPGAYWLHVRLPGFTREGITLASKRRRILHVVADKWENGGGHFERRIAFGYDADLIQVRAEYDGLMLRISIPRRVTPVPVFYPPSRTAAYNRS